MQAFILLGGVLMLILGILIGVFQKVNFVSPINSPLFIGLSAQTQKKICKKFCVIPLICGVILVVFSLVAMQLDLPRKAAVFPLLILLVLTMFDFTRVSKMIAKMRDHTFNDKLDL